MFTCSRDTKESLSGSYSVLLDPHTLGWVLLVGIQTMGQEVQRLTEDVLVGTGALYPAPSLLQSSQHLWILDLGFPFCQGSVSWCSLFDDLSAVCNPCWHVVDGQGKVISPFFFQVHNKGAKKENVRQENKYFY